MHNLEYQASDSQFDSALFQGIENRKIEIEKTRTTPDHPKLYGMVESFNKMLVTMVSAFVNKNQIVWNDKLPYVMMAYRSTEHETTETQL